MSVFSFLSNILMTIYNMLKQLSKVVDMRQILYFIVLVSQMEN